jgi:hypothetical protein
VPITRQNNSFPGSDGKGNGTKEKRRPYTSPKVLSAERLEAAAATCDPPAPPFGKTVSAFGPCTTLGS